MSAKELLSKEDREAVVNAIKRAELNTSGEIRVHIESLCKIDACDRAAYIFNYLKMYKTRERNGVLFYLALKSKRFAVIGDAGIDAKVPAGFWNSVRRPWQNPSPKGTLQEDWLRALKWQESR